MSLSPDTNNHHAPVGGDLEPLWGPDPATQRATGKTAAGWVTWRCGCLASVGHGDNVDVDWPLLLLSRIENLAGWQPHRLAAICALLRYYRTEGHHTAAWAVYNVLLGIAIRNCNAQVVRFCLSEPRWRVCIATNVAEDVLKDPWRACRQIVPLLIDDARFGQTWAMTLVRETEGPDHNPAIRNLVLSTVLGQPKVDPWVFWRAALHTCVEGVTLPKFLAAWESSLVDPKWTWRRSIAAAAVAVPHWSTPLLAAQDRIATKKTPCAKLVTDLPEDIQFQLHLLLDAQSVARLRLACRALTAFPMDRFACQLLHFECLKSATNSANPDINDRFNPVRFQALLKNALAHRHRTNTTCEELVGRVLVESVRHLSDIQLSLDLLAQLDVARDHNMAAVYLTWSLHALLNSATHTNAVTSTLLSRLLLHRHLPVESWSLVVHAREMAAALLLHPDTPRATHLVDAHAASSIVVDQPCTPGPGFLHLLQTGTVPSNDSARDLQGAEAKSILRALMSPSVSLSPVVPSSMRRLQISCPQQTSSQSMQKFVLSQAFLAAVIPPDLSVVDNMRGQEGNLGNNSPLPLSSSSLIDASAYIRHALRVVDASPETIMSALLDIPRIATALSNGAGNADGARVRVLIDVLFDDLGSASAIYAALREVIPAKAVLYGWDLVLVRGAWWWLQARRAEADQRAQGQGSQQLGDAMSNEAKVQSLQMQGMIDRLLRTTAKPLTDEDRWRTELRELSTLCQAADKEHQETDLKGRGMNGLGGIVLRLLCKLKLWRSRKKAVRLSIRM